MEEDVEEADAEMDVGEAPPTGDLVPEQAPALPATMLAMAGIWAGGQDDQVASRASARGPGVRHPPDRQSSRPQPRWMKSWLASSRRRNRRQRKPTKEEMRPPWRW